MYWSSGNIAIQRLTKARLRPVGTSIWYWMALCMLASEGGANRLCS